MAKAAVIAAAVAVAVVAVAVQEARAARILIAQPIGGRSHKNFFMGIAENLAQRNHTVTIVTSFESPRQRRNIQEIVVSGVNVFDTFPNPFNTSYLQMMNDLLADMVTPCGRALATSEVQAAVKEGFDLVMLFVYMTDCFLSVAHTLQVPFIYVTPNMVYGATCDLAGTPSFPSLLPAFGLDLEYPLTFVGRMASTLSDVSEAAYNEWVYFPRLEADCRARKLCPENMPRLSELRLNGSLFIANSVRTMENPTLPYTPTVVHAGGIHCRPAELLPEDLQQWVAGAGKPGVILFSLGTLIKSSTFPENYKKVLLEVFGSLQQRILWKWDEDAMEGLPPNVRLSKWIPQQDILGHPQLRLFITHGGLFSSQEATYHGVPVIGLPVTLDQHHNMRRVQREGWGRVLQWEDLTYDSLRGLILQTLDDSRLAEEVRRRARVMRDQPMSPGDWATYWVEYVLRHQGARHLRSPALDMPWYQLYNFDVWVVVVVVTLVAWTLASWLSYRILRTLYGWCCITRKTKKN